ncbi:MAG: NAD(P)(+) transhydrogenase (Re/Si-specific) subunit beta [Limnospira sp. PMC 1291.21]|uniref:NAD(P) transhydrogenase subunit beta n=3 Tax=Limnospira TaxID=2596745 RepID=A0A9P1NWH4_9CYAN|nr:MULTISPECIES: NAD(P)(+) transhydrogenase (Re/Si-specific) subunit beta [Limnospira]EKD10217.1 NAD(P) transhydrogenase beta subunit [Arthrospira platensis C1]MDC0836361.1 NAD(P)(+) transhydrogenase (Re/Si-specific) subunit beta [Limnoraphis robusta]MDY7054202.1 NAD(P)(+) transhydrogenase (Re/Si-specific) subunit beta [Limnospira fusiformis LS22]QJB28634.1 NAD(P)(+) transhydrogenase (Re/Si-specific) subunit beta [Limnospira fusiformis SAG 85.79]RAQ41096.1 NAD synthetase [Arthrospira sp. O9.13
MIDFLPTGIELSYLVAVTLFFFGLKKLGSPATARNGNILASIGMLIAIVATLLNQQVLNYGTILIAIAIGSAIGGIAAYKVEMTDMPQMVGLFNGLGGAASSMVAVGEFWRYLATADAPPLPTTVTAVLGVLIGGVTFTGSLIAFAKLQGIMSGSPILFPLQQPFNLALLIGFVSASVYICVQPFNVPVFLALVGISLVLGVLFVIPIGGGDMPVVISLLNSFSGLAASAAGFVVMNNLLIIAGALVGASGIILTVIMCKAMNRSITNVLFAGFGTGEGTAAAPSASGGATNKSVRNIDPEEGAMMLGYARSVVIVPGYGMAVAQAQHSVKELVDMLESLGVDVKYAIHPVAGRMPGHMNVLLAEANVPYPQLYDMDDINPQFEQTDVALVIGANDVVNPAAREDKNSPIYGMPILDVDKAKHTIVIKRGMSTGFAGVDNDLFYKDKTMMLFGSAKDMVAKLASEVKQL